jgi:hypothetical protein
MSLLGLFRLLGPFDEVNKFVCQLHQIALASRVSAPLRYSRKLHDKALQRFPDCWLRQ